MSSLVKKLNYVNQTQQPTDVWYKKISCSVNIYPEKSQVLGIKFMIPV